MYGSEKVKYILVTKIYDECEVTMFSTLRRSENKEFQVSTRILT